ncbi:amidohydrolase [Paenibacillus aceris]|uniref:amidohydrolase n=1 Tax=Paenibacillus aceris TaxID=869555 RepID=UPI0014209CD8|nr:amidohydrolase [Paenibacillus aceris]NHW35653.1 amidohydrolase family protein [Paenibacillus aceris]
MEAVYWLKNVRLESGYTYENDEVVGTETELVHLLIEHGKISKIASAKEELQSGGIPTKDAGKLLLLPSFVEKHCHLDKTLLGDSWRAPKPVKNLVERFELDKKLFPTLPTTTEERAKNLIETILKAGSTHIRTHVDIYPEIGLKHLEGVKSALSSFEGKLSHEIVAFPQHGLLRSGSQSLMREALRNGASIVGGVDPANIDGDIEASLQQMMELAVEAGAGIDLHLHDPGHLGLFTMKRLAALTVEAGWQGKVAISHAFGLGGVTQREAEEAAAMLADAGITIITAVHIGPWTLPPVPLLEEKGVTVAVGHDNVFDSWSPFGNGDILERLCRLAQVNRWNSEYPLSQSIRYITDGKTSLDSTGTRVWPQVGDEANVVFVEASCTAETVARRAKRRAVMYKGQLVSGSLDS